MAKGRTPKVDALVVCRAVATDAAHSRFDLQDVVRGRIEGREFPLKLPGLGVFFSVTGLVGSYAITVEIASLATGNVLRTARTMAPIQVFDPLQIVAECVPLSETVFPERGRYVCRLLANGDLVHETAFDVDTPRAEHVEGAMSPQSFGRALAQIKAREPGLDDARLARICGVEPEFLGRMTRSYEGLDPTVMQDVLVRLCRHFRLRPEDFFEGQA